MRIIFCLLLSSISIITSAQEITEGIHFYQELDWESIKEKARNENKDIFIDVFATWCGPCKMMDNFVYLNDTVGQIVNERFISIKLQMDSTIHDNEETKAWYDVAREIAKTYPISAYPSFLFLTPDGKLLYKDMGYKNISEFTHLVEKGLDPKNLLYSGLLENYQKGQRNYSTLGGVSVYVKKVIGDQRLSEELAGEYKQHYLDSVNQQQLLSKESIDFVDNFPNLVHVNDSFFTLCYTHPEQVDRIQGRQGWATDLVYSVITKDEIADRVVKDEKVVCNRRAWNKIRLDIHSKFDKADARKLVLDFQIDYYRWYSHDWGKWAIYKDERIKHYSSGFRGDATAVSMELNENGAWAAFLQCNNKNVLKKALRWINLAISLEDKDVESIDTKANVLYKLGRVKKAISVEESAIDLLSSYWKKKNIIFYNNTFVEFKKILSEMKGRLPTYLDEGAVWNNHIMAKIKNSRKFTL